MTIPSFYNQDLVATELEQGDLLRPNAELTALLKQYHPYYAEHAENKFFAVLTQSCDLVYRNGGYGTRYISIVPVRALSVVVNYEFDKKLQMKPDVGDPFGTVSVKGDVERFLERLLNNNEPGYFHYSQHPTVGVIEPVCAMLSLPISFRVEHYQAFLGSRILGITSIFQAKLGWLLGQSYSRVGTPELQADQLRASVKAIVSTLAVWLPNDEYKYLRSKLAEFRATNPGQPIDQKVTQTLIKTFPKKKQLVIARVLDLATGINLCGDPSTERRAFRTALDQDSEFARFFP